MHFGSFQEMFLQDAKQASNYWSSPYKIFSKNISNASLNDQLKMIELS